MAVDLFLDFATTRLPAAMPARSLADSADTKQWLTALNDYDEAIKKHSKTGKRRNGLVQLDKHVRQKLPELVESRRTEDAPNGYLTKEDICKIVEWKITVSRITENVVVPC